MFGWKKFYIILTSDANTRCLYRILREHLFTSIEILLQTYISPALPPTEIRSYSNVRSPLLKSRWSILYTIRVAGMGRWCRDLIVYQSNKSNRTSLRISAHKYIPGTAKYHHLVKINSPALKLTTWLFCN